MSSRKKNKRRKGQTIPFKKKGRCLWDLSKNRKASKQSQILRGKANGTRISGLGTTRATTKTNQETCVALPGLERGGSPTSSSFYFVSASLFSWKTTVFFFDKYQEVPLALPRMTSTSK